MNVRTDKHHSTEERMYPVVKGDLDMEHGNKSRSESPSSALNRLGETQGMDAGMSRRDLSPGRKGPLQLA